MIEKRASLNLAVLSALPNGKATEALLMRFSPREFEVLNKAFERSQGFRSRHAWLHEVLMKEARSLLAEEGVVLNAKTNLPDR